jgi:hypothetical protein
MDCAKVFLMSNPEPSAESTDPREKVKEFPASPGVYIM